MLVELQKRIFVDLDSLHRLRPCRRPGSVCRGNAQAREPQGFLEHYSSSSDEEPKSRSSKSSVAKSNLSLSSLSFSRASPRILVRDEFSSPSSLPPSRATKTNSRRN